MDSAFQTQEITVLSPHTVVLFHGLCATPLELAYLTNHLRQSGFLVETPTIDGYSYGSAASTWENWLAQAIDFVRNLQENTAGGISVGGLSMGATLALAVSSEIEDIYSVVALSTTLRYDGWAIPWYRFLLPFGYKIGFGRVYEYREHEPYGLKNEHLRAHVKKALENNRVSEIGGDRISMKHLFEADKLCRHTHKRLSLIDADLLVIHAIDDDVASVRNADLVLEKVSSANKEALYLGNSYHIITVDNERETVCSAVEFFLLHSVARSNGHSQHKLFPVVSPEWARYLRQKN
jgi:carboxylesterase